MTSSVFLALMTMLAAFLPSGSSFGTSVSGEKLTSSWSHPRGNTTLKYCNGYLSSRDSRRCQCLIAGGSYTAGGSLCFRLDKNPQTFMYNAQSGEDMTILFKYGEMIERATQYKRSHPTANVTLDFAVYKLALYVWTCVDPAEEHYGTASGSASLCPGEGNHKLIYKLVIAAREGVYVRVIYHNPEMSLLEDTIWDYLTNVVSMLPDDGTFQIHRADWKKGTTSGQMHNKFLLVSHMSAPTLDAPVTYDSTFVTTSNVDYFGDDEFESNCPSRSDVSSKHDYVQSGIVVRDDGQLFKNYRAYFDIVWKHTVEPGDIDQDHNDRHDGYKEEMKSQGTDLNYISDDGKIQAFFYPVVDEIWDPSGNAVAKYVETAKQDNVSSVCYIKINMYHLKSGTFVDELIKNMNQIPSNLHVRVVYKKDSSPAADDKRLGGYGDGYCNDEKADTRFGMGTIDEVITHPVAGDAVFRYYDCEKSLTSALGSESLQHWDRNNNKKFHTKNYLFVLHNEVSRDVWRKEYVTITGSTNGKDDAYESKANNQLVIVETDNDKLNGAAVPPVYEAHKAIFYEAYNKNQ